MANAFDATGQYGLQKSTSNLRPVDLSRRWRGAGIGRQFMAVPRGTQRVDTGKYSKAAGNVTALLVAAQLAISAGVDRISAHDRGGAGRRRRSTGLAARCTACGTRRQSWRPCSRTASQDRQRCCCPSAAWPVSRCRPSAGSAWHWSTPHPGAALWSRRPRPPRVTRAGRKEQPGAAVRHIRGLGQADRRVVGAIRPGR